MCIIISSVNVQMDRYIHTKSNATQLAKNN